MTPSSTTTATMRESIEAGVLSVLPGPAHAVFMAITSPKAKKNARVNGSPPHSVC